MQQSCAEHLTGCVREAHLHREHEDRCQRKSHALPQRQRALAHAAICIMAAKGVIEGVLQEQDAPCLWKCGALKHQHEQGEVHHLHMLSRLLHHCCLLFASRQVGMHVYSFTHGKAGHLFGRHGWWSHKLQVRCLCLIAAGSSRARQLQTKRKATCPEQLCITGLIF